MLGIITFLMQRPTLLNPSIKHNSDDRAFPTPRSWGKYCHRLITGVQNLQEIEKLASISVGTSTASEFVSFLKFQRKINLNEILAKPEKAAEIKELDLKSEALLTVSIPAVKSVTAPIPLLNLGSSKRITDEVVYFLFFSRYIGTANPIMIANNNALTIIQYLFLRT